MNNTKLKPCPFCGGTAELINHVEQFALRSAAYAIGNIHDNPELLEIKA